MDEHQEKNAEMVEIDVKLIMEKIREEIRLKGYADDILSFEDTLSHESEHAAASFDKLKLNEEIFLINQQWNLPQAHRFDASPGLLGKLKHTAKRVLRKMIRFHTNTLVDAQNGFNACVVRTVNLLGNFVDEQRNSVHTNELSQIRFLVKREVMKRLTAVERENMRLSAENEAMRKALLDRNTDIQRCFDRIERLEREMKNAD